MFLQTQHFETVCVFVSPNQLVMWESQPDEFLEVTTNFYFNSDMVINILFVNDKVISLAAEYNTFNAGV